MERIVKNKDELRRAYMDKVDIIIIEGDFAKDIKKLMPFKKVNVDTSSKTGKVEIDSCNYSASLSLSTGLAVSAIILASSIGISLIISLFKDYKSEISTEINKHGIRIKFIRKN